MLWLLPSLSSLLIISRWPIFSLFFRLFLQYFHWICFTIFPCIFSVVPLPSSLHLLGKLKKSNTDRERERERFIAPIFIVIYRSFTWFEWTQRFPIQIDFNLFYISKSIQRNQNRFGARNSAVMLINGNLWVKCTLYTLKFQFDQWMRTHQFIS